jgi:glutamine amidotransferase
MCRLFALRANHPTHVRHSLDIGPHSLRRQSGCDLRGECHESGWGIGYYTNGRPECLRSVEPAAADVRYEALANTIRATTILAHVRNASVGGVAVRNTHPFTYGRWLFAHNGTLVGFPNVREQLRASMPAHLRQAIGGDTDSEHAFFAVLSELERLAGPLDGPTCAEAIGQAVADTVQQLAELCADVGEERSQFNFVLTDGHALAATRWGHTLSWLHRRARDLSAPDQPAEAAADYQGVVVASEPTTDEAWSEVPERTLLLVGPDLTCELRSLAQAS